MVLIPRAVAAVVNIAINLVLIPSYGFAGAAWATLISYVLCFVLVVVFALRYMRWEFPYASAARVAVASGVMGACVYALERVMIGGWGGLALLILIGALIYGACLLAFREFTGPELRFAASVVGRSRDYMLHGGWKKRRPRKDE